jgi:hypothetical protein
MHLILLSLVVVSSNNLLTIISFHPQMVFLPNLSVNLRACLCGVVNYVSAQALDFLDLGQKSSFLDWKHQKISDHQQSWDYEGSPWERPRSPLPVAADFFLKEFY